MFMTKKKQSFTDLLVKKQTKVFKNNLKEKCKNANANRQLTRGI